MSAIGRFISRLTRSNYLNHNSETNRIRRFESLESRRMLTATFSKVGSLLDTAGDGEHFTSVHTAGIGNSTASTQVESSGTESADSSASNSSQNLGALGAVDAIAGAYAAGDEITDLTAPFAGTTIGASLAVSVGSQHQVLARASASPTASTISNYLLEVVDNPLTFDDETTLTHRVYGFSFSEGIGSHLTTGSGVADSDDWETSGTVQIGGQFLAGSILNAGNVPDFPFDAAAIDVTPTEIDNGVIVGLNSLTLMDNQETVRAGTDPGTASASINAGSISWAFARVAPGSSAADTGDFDGDGDVDEDDLAILVGFPLVNHVNPLLPTIGLMDASPALLDAISTSLEVFADADGDMDADGDDYDIWLDNTSNYVVSTAVDEQDSDYSYGDLSLREALVLAANYSGNSAEVRITFSDDVIAAGEIKLASGLGQLEVNSDVKIAGPGADLLLIDGNDETRVFNIQYGMDVQLSGLSIANGSSTIGGGIKSEGNLTLDKVQIENNVGGGILSGGSGLAHLYSSLTVRNSSIINNDSTNNPTGHGGGIHIDGGNVEILNSTISNNKARVGGGVWGFEAQAAIVNSTIAFNEAVRNPSYGRGGYGGYGGGVATDGGGGVAIHNSIVAQNIAVDGSTETASDLSGSFNSLSSFNLIGVGNNNGIANGVNSNMVGSSTAPKDPMLLELGDYGGPTLTHALHSESAAVDYADDAIASLYSLDEDQRGSSRIVDYDELLNNDLDIGAFELALGEVFNQ